MFLFNYLDAVVVDTPILDPDARNKIHDVDQTDERLVRVERFLDYLDRQWEPLRGTATELIDWSARVIGTREEIRFIRTRLPHRDA